MTDFPRRIRVKGGTVIHALTPEHPEITEYAMTACRRVVYMFRAVTMLSEAAPVSCKACARALSAKEA